MKKLMLPIILLLVGTASGVGAGFMLKPEPEPVSEEEGESHAANCVPTEQAGDMAELVPAVADAAITEVEYAKLSNQFVVPVIADEVVVAMVVMSLTIEVPAGQQDTVFNVEPKLRDSFLEVMFNHANVGGFSGNFTTTRNMGILREDLLRSARSVIGQTARDILVLDIVRQDV